MIPLNELHPFPNHPFRVRRDADMDHLVESIRENGVMIPGIVRRNPKGGYDIISGHRRAEASRLAGKRDMPAIIRDDLDDDAATILMIEANLNQREKMLPSERAWAYRMMRDALIRQENRREAPEAAQSAKKSKDRIARHYGESASNVMRTIRLTCLNQPLLEMVDAGRLKVGLAIQISYLDTEVQCWITDAHSESNVWPTQAQVRSLRTLFEQGQLTQEAFHAVMAQGAPAGRQGEAAANQTPEPLTQPAGPPPIQPDAFILRIQEEYFPGLPAEDVEKKIVELIEQYKLRLHREM